MDYLQEYLYITNFITPPLPVSLHALLNSSMETFITLSITITAGLIGGIYNMLIQSDETPWKPLFVSLSAALLVPLFLEIGQSELLQKITDNNWSKDENKLYFIYGGFCIIASISSRSFIDSLSSKVLAEVEKAKLDLSKNRQEQESIKNLVIADGELTNINVFDTDSQNELIELTENEKTIFDHFETNLKFLREEHFLNSTKLNTQTLRKTLQSLKEKELIDAVSLNENQLWFATVLGKKELKKINK